MDTLQAFKLLQEQEEGKKERLKYGTYPRGVLRPVKQKAKFGTFPKPQLKLGQKTYAYAEEAVSRAEKELEELKEKKKKHDEKLKKQKQKAPSGMRMIWTASQAVRKAKNSDLRKIEDSLQVQTKTTERDVSFYNLKILAAVQKANVICENQNLPYTFDSHKVTTGVDANPVLVVKRTKILPGDKKQIKIYGLERFFKDLKRLESSERDILAEKKHQQTMAMSGTDAIRRLYLGNKEKESIAATQAVIESTEKEIYQLLERVEYLDHRMCLGLTRYSPPVPKGMEVTCVIEKEVKGKKGKKGDQEEEPQQEGVISAETHAMLNTRIEERKKRAKKEEAEKRLALEAAEAVESFQNLPPEPVSPVPSATEERRHSQPKMRRRISTMSMPESEWDQFSSDEEDEMRLRQAMSNPALLDFSDNEDLNMSYDELPATPDMQDTQSVRSHHSQRSERSMKRSKSPTLSQDGDD